MSSAILSFSVSLFKRPRQRRLEEAVSKRTKVTAAGAREGLPKETSETRGESVWPGKEWEEENHR